jgi:phosphate uptake regulator
VDEEPAQSADALESLANERYSAVVSELKSYTLTTDWPGNRAAADLAAVAIDMELVGDHACFVSETVANGGIDSAGAVTDRLLDVFDAGLSINDHLGAVLFDCALDRIDALYAEEERVHRELDELFELVTTYDPRTFGDLAAVSRSLERAIYYWVDAAERLVGLLSGVEPDHLGR